MSFESLFNGWYLGESVLDIPRDGLDPNIFQFPEQGAPVINNRIRQQILDGVSQIHLILPVQDYFVMGSILTPNYNEHSDIDVTCEVDVSINPVSLENIVALLKNINGRLAIGTQHPINFFIVKGEFNHDNTEAIYSIMDNRWIKEYNEHNNFSVRRFMSSFKSKLGEIDIATAELRRDLIDYDELSKLDDNDITNIESEVRKILSNIEADVAKIVTMYDNARILRKNAFNKEMSPMEIRKFGKKNNLPDNIVYKMMERYFYKDLALKLKPLLSDGDIDKDDIPNIKKSFKDFIKEI